MSFRTGLLSVVESIRGIPTDLDMRQHEVMLRIRQWSGERAGLGSKTDTDTTIKVNYGKNNPRVRQVSSKDVVASNGMLTSSNIKVGPFTPDFLGGGVTDDAIDPPIASDPREILYRITGPGMLTAGSWFKRVNDNSLPNYSRFLYLEGIAVIP